MKLDNQDLLDLLNEKEIFHLYHANTVPTTITFIEQEGLLSRHFVESNGLYQTPQDSDRIDKQFDVFDDVFLDTGDLHKYFGRQNKYGPITFQLSNTLLHEDIEIWVTKDNPINWTTSMTHEDKYFQSVDELRQTWDKYQRQRKMFTVKKPTKPLFFNYIESIIVDDPQTQQVSTGIIHFNSALEGLKKAYIGKEYVRNKFRTRECKNCYCRSNYLNEVSINKLNKFFLPVK